MQQTIHGLPARYPRQFWVLLGGELISIIGRGMVFPFLTLYLHGKLGLPLTTAGAMLAIFGLAGAIGQGIGGTLVDRFGRKWIMAFALLAGSVTTMELALATTLPQVALAMALFGLLGSLYDPAASAMIADLITPQERAEAYSLWRVAANVGIAIGPAVGGFLANRSYFYAFGGSALGTLLYLALVVLGMHETRPVIPAAAEGRAALGGYRDLMRDRIFMAFLVLFTLSYMVYSLVLAVMPVYMKDQYGLGEQYFGLVMTLNALMVVFLQFPITRLARRANHLRVIAVGGVCFALATAGVAWASLFPHFLLVMAVLTVGENLSAPTTSTVTAELAPPELRGRYMGAMGLTWVVAWGAAPMVAGVLASWLGPRGPWLVGGAAGLAISAALWALGGRTARKRADGTPELTQEAPSLQRET